jgi:hypothetical protein
MPENRTTPTVRPRRPRYNSTTVKFASTAGNVVQGRCLAALYARRGLNPAIRSPEAKLAALAGAGDDYSTLRG